MYKHPRVGPVCIVDIILYLLVKDVIEVVGEEFTHACGKDQIFGIFDSDI